MTKLIAVLYMWLLRAPVGPVKEYDVNFPYILELCAMTRLHETASFTAESCSTVITGDMAMLSIS